jgi:inner membrane protein
MDNITHSLVGALTAESALALLKYKKPEAPLTPKIRIAFWLAAILANNFPDLDCVVPFFVEPKRLQYLLQHRGYTHTLMLAPFQALFIVGVFLGWGKYKKLPWERLELIGIVSLSVSGLVIHLLLDSLNQYGVHPFWPFYNGWFFGDQMFIVEPGLWLMILPLLFFVSKNKYLRALWISVFASALGLIWMTGFVPKAIALAMTLESLALLGLFTRVGNISRLAICYSAIALILLLFALESRWLDREIRERFEKEAPGLKVNDVILSPFPANFVCWQLITVETLPTQINYKLRRGVVSIFSNLYSPEECLRLVAPQESFVKQHPQVVWTSELRFSRETLKKMMKENCWIAAQMKFVRAPFWYRKQGKLFFGDLRFETGTRGNFSTLEIPEKPSFCPNIVPAWKEPRRDLLVDLKND